MRGERPGHLAFDVDERPPLRQAVPLGVQHLVAMLLGNVTPPLLIAGALGLALDDRAFLVQMALLVAGLATLVQSYPIGPVGGRIPVIMGTSFAFVGMAIAIGRQHGLATVFGACLIAGLVEVALGSGIGRLRALFPPLVSGIVVMLIGLTLIPVGMDYAAGGAGSAAYGAPSNLLIAALVLGVTLACNQLARGFLRYASVLAGVVVGYAVAVGFGKVDLTGIGAAPWLALPRPLPYGIDFSAAAILAMAFVYVVSAIETLGDVTGTLAAVGREPTDRELRGALLADGAMSSFGALFGAFPNTSYSQNVGLVSFTGVASRHVTAVGGVLLVVLGLVPKVGAAFATIPPAVIGGGGLIMFAMIFSSGLAIVQRTDLGQRELVVIAVAFALGLAVELRPAALEQLPAAARTFLGSGLVSGGLAALALNLLLPRRTP
ncbi:MAG: purine permease [Acidobacteria bacterium]|nr:MAG: purine permease [Acidobacteriota bacterium]